MRKLIYISIIATLSTLWSCTRVDEDFIETDSSTTITNVEILEDGQMRVTGQLGTSSFGEVSVSSRASTDDEDRISSAWFLIFGEDASYRATDDIMYTDDSPLLLCTEVTTMTTTGSFSATFPQYKGVAFMRIVANLTERENDALEAVTTWGDNDDNYYMDMSNPEYADGIRTLLIPGMKYDKDKDEVVEDEDFVDATDMAAYGTFGQYRYQSVGLDGLYSNANSAATSLNSDNTVSYTYLTTETYPKPDPDTAKNYFTGAIPMSSVGFVMADGITQKSISDFLGTTVYMVRACSKVTVAVSDSDFTLNKVYMIKCAQESRIRSTVLTSGDNGETEASSLTSVPKNLGGTIDYEALVEETTLTTPIYFYPNSGGDYESNEGAVNQDVNPQYVIVKGRSANYDTDGYYKIALKAQYAMSYKYDTDDYSLLVDENGNSILSMSGVI